MNAVFPKTYIAFYRKVSIKKNIAQRCRISTRRSIVVRLDYRWRTTWLLAYVLNGDDNDDVRCKKTFPNRINLYNNHFCVYTGTDQSVTIVRSETKLKFTDVDAILEYDTLKLSEPMFTTTCRNRWLVSYDRCERSTTRAKTFTKHTLCCSGEWWYFNNGIILNGIHGSAPCLIYYEMYAKYGLRKRELMPEPRLRQFRQMVIRNVPLWEYRYSLG